MHRVCRGEALSFPVDWGTISGDVILMVKEAEVISQQRYGSRYYDPQPMSRYMCRECWENDLCFLRILDHFKQR